jgi:hypothetical protein
LRRELRARINIYVTGAAVCIIVPGDHRERVSGRQPEQLVELSRDG